MITYSWSFPALDCAPAESGLSDVVKNIHWVINGSEPKDDPVLGPSGEVLYTPTWTASRIGVVSLDPVTDTGAFVAFDQITTGMAADWVSAKINVTGSGGIHESIAADIECQKNPPIVRKQIGISGSFPV